MKFKKGQKGLHPIICSLRLHRNVYTRLYVVSEKTELYTPDYITVPILSNSFSPQANNGACC